MLFIIHVLDKPNRASHRNVHYDAHKAFLPTAETFGVRIVMSGPLVADDGTTPIGSHFVVEATDRKAVEAFHKADPFYASDVWDKASISAFIKRHG